MDNIYKLREVKITLKPGVELIAEVNSVAEIKKLLKDLEAENLQFTPVVSRRNENVIDESIDTDNPSAIIETRADLPIGSLSSKKILAFKDNIPQLIRPQIFVNVTDALIVLLYAVEIGLKNSNIPYESFKSLYESQNIKSGSGFSMLLNNIKNASYIDKKSYEADRTIRLTPKGEQRAIEIMKTSLSKN
jgi:hypothetical protein